MVVGRLLSYWEGNCSGAMLDFQGVGFSGSFSIFPSLHRRIRCLPQGSAGHRGGCFEDEGDHGTGALGPSHDGKTTRLQVGVLQPHLP